MHEGDIFDPTVGCSVKYMFCNLFLDIVLVFPKHVRKITKQKSASCSALFWFTTIENTSKSSYDYHPFQGNCHLIEAIYEMCEKAMLLITAFNC